MHNICIHTYIGMYTFTNIHVTKKKEAIKFERK